MNEEYVRRRQQPQELGSKFSGEVMPSAPVNTQEALIGIIREQNQTLTCLVGLYRKLGMPLPPSGPEEPSIHSEKEPLPILNLIDITRKNQNLITTFTTNLTHL